MNFEKQQKIHNGLVNKFSSEKKEAKYPMLDLNSLVAGSLFFFQWFLHSFQCSFAVRYASLQYVSYVFKDYVASQHEKPASYRLPDHLFATQTPVLTGVSCTWGQIVRVLVNKPWLCVTISANPTARLLQTLFFFICCDWINQQS